MYNNCVENNEKSNFCICLILNFGDQSKWIRQFEEMSEIMPIQSLKLRSLVEEFQSPKKILANRLDVAYAIYQECNKLLKDLSQIENEYKEIISVKENALQFLKIILNVNHDHLIEPLMKERDEYKRFNPEYIPNRLPRLTKLPNPNIASSKRWRFYSEYALTHARKKYLELDAASKRKDIEYKTILLSPEERSEYQVIINNGRFYERNPDNTFKVCSTQNRISHEKKGYVAFVINTNGEISIFDHKGMKGSLTHSSMNAQKFVLASGEFKIADGYLQSMTVHSGHYKPDEENTFELLKYFIQQGVDISRATLQFFEPIENLKSLPLPKEITLGYIYNAADFFKKSEHDKKLESDFELSSEDQSEHSEDMSELSSGSSAGSDEDSSDPSAEELAELRKSLLSVLSKDSSQAPKDSADKINTGSLRHSKKKL